MNIRKPVVSGKFYPSSARALREMITSFLEPEAEQVKAIGAVVPHAGYVCSGAVAGAVYSQLLIPELVIILGPNHTGLGPAFSLMPEGAWQTLLGEVSISALAQDLLTQSSLLQPDETSHQFEHSLEVQIPFLQFCSQNPFEIIPIVVGSLQPANLLKLGNDIAGFIKKSQKETLVIASSDMTHYEPDQSAREKDKYALEAVLKLDPKMLLDRITERDISMCGVGPVAIMLSAAKELGAEKAELVMYNTSGDTCGDKDSVVGYAGVIVI